MTQAVLEDKQKKKRGRKKKAEIVAQMVIDPDGNFHEEQVHTEPQADPEKMSSQDRLTHYQKIRDVKQLQLIVLEAAVKEIKGDLKVIDGKIYSCMSEMKMPLLQQMLEWVNNGKVSSAN